MFDLSLETIIVALTYIDAHDRDLWLNIGNALKTEFGEIAFSVFDSWSQTADNYDAKKVKSTWNSYTLGKVRIGTVIYHAKQNGFDQSKHESKPIDPQEQAARQAKREQQEREAIANEQAEYAAYMKLLPQIDRCVNRAISTPYAESKDIAENLFSINSNDLHRFKNPIDPTKTIGYYLNGLITLVPYKRLDTKQLVAFQAINGAPDSEGKNKGRFAKQFIGKVFFGRGYYWMGDIDTQGVKIIVEGMSDANTLFEKVGYCSLAAGKDTQLMQAALDLRQHCQNDFIIIFGDNDKNGKGQRLAQAASKAIKNSIFLLPPKQYKDVNEWYLAEGSEGIKQMIDAAIDSKKATSSSEEDAAQTTNTSHESIDDGLNGGEWQDPESINAHYEAEDYPLDQLPEPLRLAVVAVTNYLQCPLAMVANSLLGALSLSIQGLVNVARDSKLVSVTSLFLLLIGESGERKSACDKMLTQHLNELDIERFKADSEGRKEYSKELKIWQAKLTGAENAIKRDSEKGLSTQEIEQRVNILYLEEPLAPRGTTFLLEDSTPEGLIKLMDKGHPTQGLFSSEAGIVFGSHGMASDSAMRNMATLNKFWDGEAIRVTRSEVNKNVLLTGRRLALSLAVQARTVRAFFDGSKGLARGTGFGARFLIAWPKSTQGFRPYKEPANSFSALEAFKRKTLELINTDLVMDEKTGAIEAHTLILSAKAKAVWVAFYNDTEAELKTGGELTDIKDVTSKAGDNAARIAALFHIYEHGVTGTISEDHMTKACHLMAWYLMESRRFFGEIALPKELSNATLLDTWLIDYCKDNQLTRISTMLARQLCPNSIRSKAVYEETIKNLTELKRIRTTKEGKKKWIEVNPKLLEA